jgi:hypothetical protein
MDDSVGLVPSNDAIERVKAQIARQNEAWETGLQSIPRGVKAALTKRHLRSLRDSLREAGEIAMRVWVSSGDAYQITGGPTGWYVRVGGAYGFTRFTGYNECLEYACAEAVRKLSEALSNAAASSTESLAKCQRESEATSVIARQLASAAGEGL